MKKNSVLKSEIKNMYGNVLGIGNLDESIVNKLDSNKKIMICNILSNNSYENDEEGNEKLKKISISNLRKFKKKRVNYLICDYSNIDKYLNTFIKDSIYITNNYIYFCTNNKKIKKLYERYDITLKEVKCSDTNILIIDTSKAKNNYIKELIYKIIDFIEKIIDIITELLIN